MENVLQVMGVGIFLDKFLDVPAGQVRFQVFLYHKIHRGLEMTNTNQIQM